MSYTSLYCIYKTKSVSMNEFANGHGSGPAIWEYIARKLTGKSLPFFGELEWFWPLWKDNRLCIQEKAVLLSTYDYAMVEIDKLKDFSDACKNVHNKIINNTEWKWNHFNSIGNSVQKIAKNHDYRCRGIGIGCTSVCDPWEFWDPNRNKCWGVYTSIESL